MLTGTMETTLLLTGFEPFLDVRVNPSGEVARALDGAVLADGRRVRGVVLPVSFDRAPGALRRAAEAAAGELTAVVSLGVHRGPQFRLEGRARARFGSGQPDNDGVLGATVELVGPEERRPSLDLDRLEQALRAAGAPSTSRSEDAGGYLCERIFREGLDLGAERGIPALFLHVPPADEVAVERQVQVVRAWLDAME